MRKTFNFHKLSKNEKDGIKSFLQEIDYSMEDFSYCEGFIDIQTYRDDNFNVTGKTVEIKLELKWT